MRDQNLFDQIRMIDEIPFKHPTAEMRHIAVRAGKPLEIAQWVLCSV